MPNQRKQGKKKIGAWVDDADIAATYPFCSTMIDQLATTEHTPWTVDEWAARWRQEADARNALFQEHQQLKREIAHANREAAFYSDACDRNAELLAGVKKQNEALRAAIWEAARILEGRVSIRPEVHALQAASPSPQTANRLQEEAQVNCYTS